MEKSLLTFKVVRAANWVLWVCITPFGRPVVPDVYMM